MVVVIVAGDLIAHIFQPQMKTPKGSVEKLSYHQDLELRSWPLRCTETG